MQIKDAYDYLVHLIFCAIHKETPEPLPGGITHEQVLECAIDHEVAGFAYFGLKRLEVLPDAQLMSRWKERYMLGVQRNALQEQARKELVDRLHEKGIATLELQGTKVKKYYPSPELRMMGDIDLIIEKSQLTAAEEILKALGYETERQNDFEVDGKKNKINVEVHTEFFPEYDDFTKILKNPYGNVTISQNFEADAGDRTFLLYHLAHCLKHYWGYGIGIRRILDLYILDTKFTDKALKEEIFAEIAKTGYEKQARALVELAGYWFGGQEPGRDLSEVIRVVKAAGSQGNADIELQHQLNSRKRAGKHFIKLRYLLSLIFPPKEKMYHLYPFCQKHRYPLALCWIHRAIRLPFKKGRWKKLKHYICRIWRK